MKNKFNIHQKASNRIQDFYMFNMREGIEINKAYDKLLKAKAIGALKNSLKQ